MRSAPKIVTGLVSMLAGMLAQITCTPAGEGVAPSLAAGLYEMDVRLELPHIGETVAPRRLQRCLPANATPAEIVQVTATPNLAACPVVAAQQDGADLRVDRRCLEVNGGYANGQFTLGTTQFSGRIEMKMGGKNMTLTEVQTARRIGECPAGL
jgi:Protein of unknown function (DUF3617)